MNGKFIIVFSVLIVFHNFQSTKYSAPYDKDHEVLKKFWNVFHNSAEEIKRRFLGKIQFIKLDYVIRLLQ